jgi:NAD dependent epimerase/dehydratase
VKLESKTAEVGAWNARELEGKKVLVTGADGFIGSHLVERLVADGAQVRAMCLYNSQGSWGWLDEASADVRQAIEVRLGDIRDAEWVAEACRGVDVVLHLAALIAIPYSYSAPRSFVDTNVTGTLNMLEAARRAGVSRVVQTSTSEVYGTPRELPIRETHPLNAQSPYAATKVAADQLALSYHRSFEVPVAVLRPFNTYGPRQSTRAVIPTILTQLMAGKRQIQLGRLDTRRDLTFVTDTVDGFVRAATAPGCIGEVTQLGTYRSPSIQDVFQAACNVLGVNAEATMDPRRLRPDPSEVLVLEADPSLARERLGWTATVDLEEGLRRTVSWLERYRDRYKVDFLHT